MEKIKMPVPIAELDGDEMTHVLWGMIKDTLIKPFVDLNTEYYDLSLPHREETADAVTAQTAEAIKRLKIGVKCATITPNLQRQEEYGLTQLWKSPNATIRAALDGTVFRAPIMIDSIKPVVKNWKKPITIARHAYGDVYKCTEFRIPGAGKAELVFTGADGSQQRATVFDFEGAGVLQGQYNKDDSIRSFARSCFNYALDVKQDLWFGAKDTISKKYDHIFKDISIEELSKLTNRSLTSFKKEFRRHFMMPPHKWYIRQRLMHSRLLLISTSKSISEIGNACTFPNTSHFIKLFKKEYQMTPAAYRNRHITSLAPEAQPAAKETEEIREAL